MNLVLIIDCYKLILAELKKEMRFRENTWKVLKKHRDTLGTPLSNESVRRVDMAEHFMYNAVGRAQYLDWYTRVLTWSIDNPLVDILEDDEVLSKYFTEDGPTLP